MLTAIWYKDQSGNEEINLISCLLGKKRIRNTTQNKKTQVRVENLNLNATEL